MPRKNKNRSYNFQPKRTNVPYNSDYNNYVNYNIYNKKYSSDCDDYNYNTMGNFKKPKINGNNFPNRVFTNRNYPVRTFDNNIYNDYHNEYVNYHHASQGTLSEQDTERDSTFEEYLQNEHLGNGNNINPVFRNMTEMSGCIESGSAHANVKTEENQDDMFETDTMRPSTRTVSKKSLKEITDFPTEIKKQKANPSYTDFWKKGAESKEAEECLVFHLQNKKKKNKRLKRVVGARKMMNKFEKKVKDMLSAPVEMSKGRSLLEKMGWKGGGLGKDGEGIIEPIIPKATYAITTMGLGQLTKEEVEQPMIVDQVYYKTLTCILEFVRNYLEHELKFEASLSRYERKCIHRTVEELRLGKTAGIPQPYKSVVDEINHYNDYLLVTESTGQNQKRYLTLYKEAYDDMFLITPEDLEDEVEVTEDKHVPRQVHKNIMTIKKKISAKVKTENILMDAEIKSNTENEEEMVETKNIMNCVNSQVEKETKETQSISISSVEEIDCVSISSIEDIEIDCVTDKAGNIQDKFTLSNLPNRQIKNEIMKDAENNGIDIKNEDPNNIQNKVYGEIVKEINNVTENKIISNSDSKTESDIQSRVNSQVEKETKFEIENKIIDDNNMQNQVNSEVDKKIARDIEDVRDVDDKQEGIQKDKPKDVNDILDVIINYFLDFTKDSLYTEFRFLGPFDSKERRAIDMFFAVCKKERLIVRSKEVLDLFNGDDYYLELGLDNNGRYLVHKFEKKMEPADKRNPVYGEASVSNAGL